MKNAPRRLILVTALVVVAGGAAPAWAEDVTFGVSDVRTVFFISKNENKNEVHYGIHLDERCKPAGKEPVFVYWQEKEKGPAVVLPLKMHEEPAYGIESQKVLVKTESATQLLVRLKALPNRDFLIQVQKGDAGCTALAYTKIRSIPSVFERAFIVVSMWRIRELTMFGSRLDNKKPISETLQP